METFRLNRRQRRQLRVQARSGTDVRSVRRAIALLELDEGHPVEQVAETFGVSRQTLYNWRARLDAGDASTALRDRIGRGRPTVWTEPVRRFVEWSMQQPSEELGYSSVDWTTALMQEHVGTYARVRVSDTTMRALLHDLGYTWKRPR